MNDRDEDLRATADSIADDARRLARIEAQKGELEPGDPALLTLSAQAEEIARELVPKTVAERQLAAETAG